MYNVQSSAQCRATLCTLYNVGLNVAQRCLLMQGDVFIEILVLGAVKCPVSAGLWHPVRQGTLQTHVLKVLLYRGNLISPQ